MKEEEGKKECQKIKKKKIMRKKYQKDHTERMYKKIQKKKQKVLLKKRKEQKENHIIEKQIQQEILEMVKIIENIMKYKIQKKK